MTTGVKETEPSFNRSLSLHDSNINTAFYQNFFLLQFDLKHSNGESAQLSGSLDHERAFLSIPATDINISCSDLHHKVLPAPLRKHGVYNLVRMIFGSGNSVMFQVEFASLERLEQFITYLYSTAQPNTFYTSIIESLKAIDSSLSSLLLQLTLYLVEPQIAQKDCVFHKVTQDNYITCFQYLSESFVFDYRNVSIDAFTREINLYDAIKELQGIGRWFALGIRLGIPYHTMDGFKVRHGEGSERGLIEVLQLWINSNEASWSTLVDCLRRIGLPSLAKKLATKYGCVHILDIPIDANHHIKDIEELEIEKVRHEEERKSKDINLTFLQEEVKKIKVNLSEVTKQIEQSKMSDQTDSITFEKLKEEKELLNTELASAEEEIHSQIQEYIRLQETRDDITKRINDCYHELDAKWFEQEKDIFMACGDYVIINDKDTPPVDVLPPLNRCKFKDKFKRTFFTSRKRKCNDVHSSPEN